MDPQILYSVELNLRLLQDENSGERNRGKTDLGTDSGPCFTR